VLQIADQLLERADTLHARHLIHRDIKPVREREDRERESVFVRERERIER
jgi:hypothetical protein